VSAPGFAPARRVLFALLLATATGGVAAQELLVRNATVHTMTAAGRLDASDILVRGGRIEAIGRDLQAPEGVPVVDAGGRPVTPGLFAGLGALGLEEIPAEAATVDHGLAFAGQTPPQEAEWRPEFDVTLAFNPESAVIGVNRVEGFTYAMLTPSALAGGSFVAGQGAAVTLDGRFDAELAGSRTLFVDLGSAAAGLAGGSRAAHYMLLEQAIAEARARGEVPGPRPLLTPQGRSTLARYLDGGRVVFRVDRAADILQVLKLAGRHRLRAVIAGGAEAWKVAPQLASAGVPVLLDPLVNLPVGFDHLGARLDNAALLHAAGVSIVIDSGDTHNARKNRQRAGNAVANGLPWEAGLAALTSAPARVFGLTDRGTLARGQAADLVLWSGDPLEVTSWAEQVWIGGRAMPMQSRQTELLQRYRNPAR
jgi:imidazolonepropionase-like amidohydrolase